MTAPAFTIERLDGAGARAAVPALAEILIDCVEGGASVSFILPVSIERLTPYWQRVADAVEAGDTALFVARDATGIHGTVQLHLALPENQPHRADVAKLLVHRRARRRGMAEALMREAESFAQAVDRSLLVLDTASDAADRIYRRLGWTCLGVIPDYALNPDGTFCDTTVFWKSLKS